MSERVIRKTLLILTLKFYAVSASEQNFREGKRSQLSTLSNFGELRHEFASFMAAATSASHANFKSY